MPSRRIGAAGTNNKHNTPKPSITTMKGKISILAAAIALAACSEESQIAEIVAPEGGTPSSGRSLATVEIVDYVPGDGTRAVLNTTGSSPVFLWEQGDVLGVYAGGESTSLTNLSIKTIDSNAPSKAIFHATGFNMNSGETYHGFFPYNSAATNKTSVPVRYSGKNYTDGITQEVNNGYSHLGAIDYQWATATAYGTSDAADINFKLKHLSAICRFRITGVPAGVKFSRLSISCDGIITQGTVNLTAGTPDIAVASGSQTTQNITLGNGVGNGFAAASDGTLTIYTLMAPVNLYENEKKITLNLYSDQSDMVMWSGTVSGKNMLAGKSYGYTVAYGTTSPTETDTWVDLGLTRADGTPILFGTKNLGAATEATVGTMPKWTAQDPVPALRGSNWRTPSQLELHRLFSDASLKKEVTGDGITISNTTLKTSLFIPFTDSGAKACIYWTSTTTASYWPVLNYTEYNSNLEARVCSKYCQLEVQSYGIAYNLGNIGQSNTLAIRPVYVGPTGN